MVGGATHRVVGGGLHLVVGGGLHLVVGAAHGTREGTVATADGAGEAARPPVVVGLLLPRPAALFLTAGPGTVLAVATVPAEADVVETTEGSTGAGATIPPEALPAAAGTPAAGTETTHRLRACNAEASRCIGTCCTDSRRRDTVVAEIVGVLAIVSRLLWCAGDVRLLGSNDDTQ